MKIDPETEISKIIDGERKNIEICSKDIVLIEKKVYYSIR